MAFAILYLHGVGQTVMTDKWYDALAASLEAQGVEPPPFSSSRILAPTYVDLLQGVPPTAVREPTPTERDRAADADRLERRAAYGRRQSRAVADLPGTTASGGLGGLGSGFDPTSFPTLPADLADAHRYLSSKSLRSAVLHRVIERIGKHRDLIVIGHSLGSLVAIDLMAHLPPKVTVRRLITIGSPAGALGMTKKNPGMLLREFPYHQVDTWVNVLSPYDAITYGLGLSPLFPAAADVRVAMPPLNHGSVNYLGHPAVGKVLATALQPPVRASVDSRELTLPLAREEHDVLDSLRYAALVAELIGNPQRQRRYRNGLDAVVEEVAQRLSAMRTEQHRPPSPELDALAAGGSIDLAFSRRDGEAELLFAILCATNNPIAPYEVDAKNEQLQAVATLWRDHFGYSQQDADKVVSAVKAARDALDAGGGKLLWGAIGLALLAAGPVGLLAAAPAGLAGAAAMTSALAAFGPGGMIGGLALAGGLMSAGTGVLTVAASPTAMDASMIRTQAVRCMAYARAQRDLDIPGDRFAAWHYLTGWHSELATERARLQPISDRDAPTLKSLGEKIRIVEKAIRWLAEHELAPALQG